jgi:hypothetical protein
LKKQIKTQIKLISQNSFSRMIQKKIKKEIPEIKVIINQIYLSSTFKNNFMLEKALKKKRMKLFFWNFPKEKILIHKTVYNKAKIRT